jgi:hypothetical protein
MPRSSPGSDSHLAASVSSAISLSTQSRGRWPIWLAEQNPDATRWPSTMSRSDTLKRGAKSTALQRILSGSRSSVNQQEQGSKPTGEDEEPHFNFNVRIGALRSREKSTSTSLGTAHSMSRAVSDCPYCS